MAIKGISFSLKLGGLAMLAGTLFSTAQNPPSARPGDATVHLSLPPQCLQRRSSSEKISALLETVRDHPSVGAYNTLGALYAQANRLNCALPAFDNALKLDNQNWEVHYNFALALLQKGDRIKAKRELESAIQLKPDAVSAHFALGTLLQGEEKLSEAESEFRAAVGIDRKFAPAALKLSEVLLAEDKAQFAISVLQDAIKQASEDQAGSLETALGVAYTRSGEVEKGLEELKKVEASHTDLADARLALGFALLSAKRNTEAASTLLEYTHLRPKDAQGFSALGRAYTELGKDDLATEAFRRAVTLDPRDGDAHFQLGLRLAESGKTDESIEQLRMAERIRPTDAETHRQLALLLDKSGDEQNALAERRKFSTLKSVNDKNSLIAKLNAEANRNLSQGNAKAAAEDYGKAVQLKPNDAKLRYNLALALYKSGNLVDERKELEKAIELDPNLAVAHNQLGLLALASGQHAEAEQRFKKALAIEPQFAQAESNLGVLYSQQGRNAEAASLFQQATQHDPKYTKAYVNLGLLLAQKGSFPDAERQFRTAIQVDQNYAGAYSALGMLQAKTGRGADAVKSFEKAVALEPASAEAHLNLGIALVDRFDRPTGFKEFSEAARLDPNLAGAHYNLGRFFFETGKYEDASRELETAIHLQPDFAGALYFLALTKKQQNEPERSTELLQKVVVLDPENANAQYLLGQNLEHSGDRAGAVQHWRAAVQAEPNHSQALYNLAKSLSKMHDPEAQQYQDRFEALQRKQKITDRVAELGNFALEAANAQNWPQAMEQMNEAIQLCGSCPESAHLHRNLGLFYVRTGNLGEAEKELHTALTLAPDDTDAQNAVAMVERIRKEQSK